MWCKEMFPLYDENRRKSLPFVTWSLIIINALVFWWELNHGTMELQTIFYNYGEIPALVMQGKQLHTIITSMFLHADLWHIVGNMVYLFVFGDNVEDRFGHTKFLLLYLAFGIVGGLTHSAVAVMFGGIDAIVPAIGASGAVSGILASYVLFFPNARIISIVPSFYFIRIAPVPAWIFIGFWFILQLLYSGTITAVAYMAHIGGFVTGFVIATIFKATTTSRPSVSTTWTTKPRTADYCLYCGKPLPDNAVYCPICGSRRSS
jgi:membrane associated rhomboid family serine protease